MNEILRFVTLRAPETPPVEVSEKYLRVTADPEAPEEGGMGELASSLDETDDDIVQGELAPRIREFVDTHGMANARVLVSGPDAVRLNPRFGASLATAFAAASLAGVRPRVRRQLELALKAEIAANELSSTSEDLSVGDLLERTIVVDLLDDLVIGPDLRHAHFGPVGIGDLQIVRQRLLKYELGEVAHIENVLRSEFRERTHRSLSISEETTVVEEETTTETEEDLQSHERFALSSEMEKEIQAEQELEAGLTVTAKYGPTVEATATLDFSSRRAKRSSRRRSSEFAQELTRRSLRRVQERVREQRTRRVTREIEETNIHRFNNMDGTADAVGVYRYVDQIFEAQLVNYGKRLMFEFIIPEPGGWLEWARGEGKRTAELPEKPAAPDFAADDLDEESYLEKGQEHGAGDLPPPPSQGTTVAVHQKDVSTRERTKDVVAHTGEIPIPDGFEATKAHVTLVLTPDPTFLTVGDGNYVVDYDRGGPAHDENRSVHGRVTVARKEVEELFRPAAPWTGNTSASVDLDRQTGAVPYSLTVHEAEISTLTIEVECERTERSFAEWRSEVYGLIWDAYQKALARYNEAVAAIPPEPEEFPPPSARLREIERVELKRRALELLGRAARDMTGIGGDKLPLVVDDEEAPLPKPQGRIDTAKLEALAPEIRFGEQAFEWAHLTFVLYPYYWADPGSWASKAVAEYAEPLHGMFLRAGAARVLVPVRPGFEETVHYFLVSGGTVAPEARAPKVTSPLWLPLYREIQEQQEKDPADIEILDCWEVRLPTTLVMLDPDGKLPEDLSPSECPEDEDDA